MSQFAHLKVVLVSYFCDIEIIIIIKIILHTYLYEKVFILIIACFADDCDGSIGKH